MNTDSKSDTPMNGDIEELLPWHAAGTLDRRDAQRVEQALARDPELARRYELVREELGTAIHLNESLGAPSARTMEALFAKIDAEPARQQARSLGIGAAVAGWLSSLTPRTLAWSAGAAAIAILLQAGFITGVVMNERQGANYETASAPASAPAAAGSFALIRFRPDANAADITAFLETNKLTLAGGPSAGGLYRVRLSATAQSKDEAAAILKTLQADKVVGFIAATK
jgi:hypothetical protein